MTDSTSDPQASSERNNSTHRDSNLDTHHRDRNRDHSRDRDRDKQREKKSGHRDKNHRHRHSHRHSSRERDREHHSGNDREHRHKRDRPDDEAERDKKHSGRRGDDDREKRRKHHHSSSHKARDDQSHSTNKTEDLSPADIDDSEKIKASVKRDTWMTAPSALDIDYVNRSSAPKEREKIYLSNTTDSAVLESTRKLDLSKASEQDQDDEEEVEYIFGDDGSSWRMTRLRAVHIQSQETGRSINDIAIERYGSLKLYDDAREEEKELERRGLYGKGYVGKEKPTGELFAERKAQEEADLKKRYSLVQKAEAEQGEMLSRDSRTDVSASGGQVLDATALNKLKAKLMKAQLRSSPDAAKLEAEYNAALAASSNTSSTGGTKDPVVVLGAQNSRLLAGTRGEVKGIDTKRGRERGLVQENEDMSIEDMVREERRTRDERGGQGMRDAERIAKDVKFGVSLPFDLSLTEHHHVTQNANYETHRTIMTILMRTPRDLPLASQSQARTSKLPLSTTTRNSHTRSTHVHYVHTKTQASHLSLLSSLLAHAHIYPFQRSQKCSRAAPSSSPSSTTPRSWTVTTTSGRRSATSKRR
jgi:hypothetical protein